MKKTIFSNFGFLEAAEDIKFFEIFFDFLVAHTERQLFVAITYQDSNFYFFTAP